MSWKEWNRQSTPSAHQCPRAAVIEAVPCPHWGTQVCKEELMSPPNKISTRKEIKKKKIRITIVGIKRQKVWDVGGRWYFVLVKPVVRWGGEWWLPLQDVGSRGLARLEASGLAFWEKPKAEQGDDLPFSVGLRISDALKCRSRGVWDETFWSWSKIRAYFIGWEKFSSLSWWCKVSLFVVSSTAYSVHIGGEFTYLNWIYHCWSGPHRTRGPFFGFCLMPENTGSLGVEEIMAADEASATILYRIHHPLWHWTATMSL